MDSITETTSKGWFFRIKESIKGVAFGLLLFALSFPLLYWNEGRSVRQAEALKEGASAMVSVTPDKVDQEREGFLVHLTGPAVPGEIAVDREFGVHAHDSLRLERVVEMYQWQETESKETSKKVGGSETETVTYTYEKVWSKELINSRGFKDSDHENPSSFPYPARTFEAQQVTVGAYHLGNLITQLGNWQPFDVDRGQPDFSPRELPQLETEPALEEPNLDDKIDDNDPFASRDRLQSKRAKERARQERERERQRQEQELQHRRELREAERANQRMAVDQSMHQSFLAQFGKVDGGYYLGDDPRKPEVGDTRITFRVVPAGPLSLLAQQSGDSFVPYTTGNGNKLYRVMTGEHSAADMFGQMEAENAQLTWILRLVGFLMMFFGMLLVFRPLAVVADVVPLFGSLLSAGVGLLSFFIAAPLTLATIAVSWFAVRPILGALLGVAAVAVMVMGFKVSRKKANG